MSSPAPLINPSDLPQEEENYRGVRDVHPDDVEISKPKPSDFDVVRFVGSGGFGNVYLTRDRFDHLYYAMKVVPKDAVRKKNNVSYMKSEKNIMIKLGYHPFIVFLHYTFQTKKNLYLVMDFLAGGELFFHLRKKGIVVESVARIYFAEMVLAIDHMHAHNVIHRDLKPENVMLNSMGHVSITDFGLAKDLSIGSSMTTKTVCGTLEYMPPEMLLKLGYGKNVDFWLLGILLYELLVGYSPFSNGAYKDNLGNNTSTKEIERRIVHDKPSLPGFLAPDTHSILRGLLEKDVSKRLGFSKSNMFVLGGMASLKAHKFFQGLDFHALFAGRIQAPYDMQELHALIRGLESGEYDETPDTTPSSHSACTSTTPTTSSSATQSPRSSSDAPSAGSGGGGDVAVTSPSIISSTATASTVAVDTSVDSSLSTGKNNPNSTLSVNTAVATSSSANDKVENLITANFANAYTSRPISISFLEDCICNGSTMHEYLDSCDNAAGTLNTAATATADQDFLDFDFSSKSWYTSEKHLSDIKADIKRKLNKLFKRKKFEEIRSEKENEKAMKLKLEKERLDTDRQRKQETTRLSNRNIEIDKLSKTYSKDLVELDAAIAAMQQEESSRLEAVDKANKKLKKFNKTLREISDIEEIKKDKSKKLNPEQKEKLSKKTEVENERDEVEEWLEANCKGKINEDSPGNSEKKIVSEFSIKLSELQVKADLLQEKYDSIQKERSENITTITQLQELLSSLNSSSRGTITSNSKDSDISDGSFVSINNQSNPNSSIVSEDNCSFYTPTNNPSPQGIYKPPVPIPSSKPAIPSPYGQSFAYSHASKSPIPQPSFATASSSSSSSSKPLAPVPYQGPVPTSKTGGGSKSLTASTSSATTIATTTSSTSSVDDVWEVPKNVAKKTNKR